MSRAKAFLGIALIFMTGIFTGVVLTGKFMEIRVQRAIDSGPEEIRSMIQRRLAQKLSLTKAQSAQIDRTLADAQTAIAAIREKSAPGIREIVERTRAEIRAVLTPAQAEEYDAQVARSR